jgi:hypothetical protein
LLAGRTLMTLTASLPKATNTTTITPRMVLPMPSQRYHPGWKVLREKSLAGKLKNYCIVR